MRVIKLFLLGIISGILLLVISGVVYSYYNGDKIAAIGIRYVSGFLESKVTVDEVHFSVIKHFPYATLELTNVCALSKQGFKLNVTDSIQSDTLLKTKHLYLKFDLLQVLQNKFKLSRIEIDKGVVYLLINNNSYDNFSIIKTNKQEAKSDFSIDLTKLELTDCRLYLVNENKKLYLNTWISKSYVSGKFSGESFEVETELKSKLQHLKIEGVSYCRNIPLQLSMQAKSKNNNYTIKKGELIYAGLPLSISGSFTASKGFNLNVALHAKKLDINNLKSHLSVFLGIPTTISDLQGKLSVDAKVTGLLDKNSVPAIFSYFEWTNGELEILMKKEKHRLTNISLTATYSNGLYKNAKSSVIKSNIKNVSFENSSANGNLSIVDFSRPVLSTTFNSSVQLVDINKFINSPDTIVLKSGQVLAKGGFSGKLDSIQYDLAKTIWLDGELKNGGCEIFKKKYSVEFANTKFSFANDLQLTGFTSQFNTIPIQFTGKLDGFKNYVYRKSKILNIEGNAVLDWFDAGVLASGEKSESKETSKGFEFPDNLNFALNFLVKKLKVSTFQASDVSGFARYKPKIFVLSNLNFYSMNGTVAANGAIAQQINGDLSVNLQSQVNQLTISEIFKSFDNFGQKVLLPQHLKGTLTGSVNFSADWDKNLKVYQDRIVTDAKFEITKGELIDFKPLEGLSKFIALSELKHIYFSTIKNQIFIKNKVITIPQMDIASSALNLQVSGTHTFQNEYDYHMKLALSEILFRKARTNKDVNDNAEEDKDKGAKLYLTIKGQGENYKVKYDSKSSRKAFVETIANERKTISNLLKKEFTSSTSDTVSTSTPPKKFNIDWEDAPKTKATTEPVTTTPAKETKKQKFKIEWEN